MGLTVKTIRIIILSILVSIGAIALWLFIIDGSFSTERTITINENPQTIANKISTLGRWDEWSPWLNTGTESQTQSISPDSILSFNHILGGRVRLTKPAIKKVGEGYELNQTLNFDKPFECQSQITWTITPADSGSATNMVISGTLPFWYRALTQRLETILYMDVFRSLNLLKDYIELGYVESQTHIEGISTNPQLHYVGIRNSCQVEELDSTMQETFIELTRMMQLNGIEESGTLSCYYDFGINAEKKCEFLCAAIIDKPLENSPASMETGKIKESKVLKIKYNGDYRHISNAWVSGLTYIRAKGLKIRKNVPPHEIYINTDANSQSPNEWQTELYIPVR